MVSSITPNPAVEGSTVTVQGRALDSVAQLWIGGQQITPIQKDSANQLRFVLPSGILSGVLRVVNASNETSSATSLGVLLEPAILSTSPTQLGIGDTLTLTGRALGNVQLVVVDGVGVLPINRSDTSIQAVIPSGAANGNLSLVLVDGSSRNVAQSFSLKPPLSTVTALSPAGAQVGQSVTITGTNLGSAVRVLVNGIPVSIVSQSASNLVFVAPSVGGVVELEMVDGVRVAAGTLSVSAEALPQVHIERIEFAQSYSQPAQATYQALVPGKAAWLRVFVTANRAIPSPAVTATLNCTGQSPLTLTGPSVLPTSQPARTNLQQTFTVALPGNCVTTGLQVQVVVASTAPLNSGAANSAFPTVASGTNMNLVLVPLVTNGSTAAVPDTATVKRLLARAFPLDAARITVSVRSPYILATTTVDDSNSWSDALAELQALNATEGTGRHYYGLIPNPHYNGGIAGLGYVNSSSSSAWLSAIGLDAVALDPRYSGADASLLTMAHEIGHNLGLHHANCGVTGDVDMGPGDPSYANAGLGPNPVFESDSDRNGTPGPLAVYQPSYPNNHDLMSYCDGEWFSDYNYQRIQQFLGSFSYPKVSLLPSPRTYLDFQGALYPDGSVVLSPPSARNTRLPYVGSGEHILRLRTQAGSTIDTPFRAIAVPDLGDGHFHFQASIPDPGPIESVDVLHLGRSVSARLNAPPAASALAQGVSSTSPTEVQWHEEAGRLVLHWDSVRYPVLQVRHQGTRTTLLATQLRGGAASVSLQDIPAGGQWEFSLSAGWNAHLVSAPRTP